MMPSEALFALFILAGGVIVAAGFRLGARHERRAFKDALRRETHAQRSTDGFEDGAEHRDRRPH
jgi:hypothetical protein